ncbi:MAG: hypothetical protein IPP07_21225 [Holophagales bacterium]|nr:hypothetical protein [Holophagales bacterium]
MLLILTGGTEGLALSQLSHLRGPVVLLAHPTHNSFPAALEILARVRQMNRRGKIVFLGEGPESGAELQRTLAVMSARQALDGMRLGRIGTPSEWLVASLPDESGPWRSCGESGSWTSGATSSSSACGRRARTIRPPW